MAGQFDSKGNPIAGFSQMELEAYADTGNPNFAADGDLVIPMTADLSTSDDLDDMIPRTVDTESVMSIETRLKDAKTALAGLQKLALENEDTRSTG